MPQLTTLTSMEKVIPDPVLSAFELPLRRIFYPYGFPLELETNSADVIAAAAEGWGAFEQAFDEPPVRFCLGVSEGGADALAARVGSAIARAHDVDHRGSRELSWFATSTAASRLDG